MIRSKEYKGFKTLKKRRQDHHLTSKQMAEKLCISKAFYCQLENRTRRLSYDMAVKIASIFNSKPDKIFYDDFKSL